MASSLERNRAIKAYQHVEEFRIEHVVSGFVRRMESSSSALDAEDGRLHIPRPLVDLIIRFHHRYTFLGETIELRSG